MLSFSEPNRGKSVNQASDLGEEIGDVEALSDESEQTLEGLAFLGVELAVEERSDVDVLRIVVEVGVRADPEHHRRRLAQTFRRGSELREHFASDSELREIFLFIFSLTTQLDMECYLGLFGCGLADSRYGLELARFVWGGTEASLTCRWIKISGPG